MRLNRGPEGQPRSFVTSLIRGREGLRDAVSHIPFARLRDEDRPKLEQRLRDLPPGNSGSKYNETKNWAKIAIIVAIGAIGFSAIAFAVLWSMANGINP